MKPIFRLVGGLDLEPRKPASPAAGRLELGSLEGLPESVRNKRLRRARMQAWEDADAMVKYWRARLDFFDAEVIAHRRGLLARKAVICPIETWCSTGRHDLVQRWRDALAGQLLTPAWNANAIAWKRAALARGEHAYTSVSAAEIERAIAKDEAFLAAHPVKQQKRRSLEAG